MQLRFINTTGASAGSMQRSNIFCHALVLACSHIHTHACSHTCMPIVTPTIHTHTPTHSRIHLPTLTHILTHSHPLHTHTHSHPDTQACTLTQTIKITKSWCSWSQIRRKHLFLQNYHKNYQITNTAYTDSISEIINLPKFYQFQKKETKVTYF